ncbi:hypothetical protein L6R53_20170 [Myxococcota bacterium]|nr:hypothetical protein [Myxococcota bacterium]
MPLPLDFRILGRGLHPVIDDARALALVPELPDPHWVATAVTVDTLRADPGLLALVDTDTDGRIRSDELRVAIRWCAEHLSDSSGLSQGSDRLKLSAVKAQAPEGPAILEAARRVLRELDDPQGAEVGLAQVREVRARHEARGLSEAGRVLPAAAGDDAPLAAFLARIVAVTGGEPHPLGEAAASAGTLDRFLAEGQAWLAWHDQGVLPAGQEQSDLLPLGAGTAAAVAALEAVQDKLDQYFLLCDAVALDPGLAGAAWVDATGSDLLDAGVARSLLQRAPLARPRADGQLDLAGALNPAWRGALQALQGAAGPLLREGSLLDRAAVEALAGRLAPFRAWRDGQPAAAVGADGAEPLRAMLADATLPERTRALLAQSEVAAAELAGIKSLEKLILLQQGLLALANSTTSLAALFDPQRTSLFAQGELVLDGRVFTLAIRVLDRGRAEAFAAKSPLFTMFVEVGEKGTALDRELMIPLTAGERGHVAEGMWGVFRGIDGKEHHARVRKLIANPISIREALMAPFRKLNDALQAMADKAAADQSSAMDAKVAASAQAAVDKSTTATASAVAAGEAAVATPAAATPAAATPAAATSAAATSAAATPATAAAAAPTGASGMSGQLPMLLAGGGLALAALSSAAAYVVDMIWGGAGSLAASFLALPAIAALPPGALGTLQVLAIPVALLLILLGLLLVPFLIYAIPISIATWLRLRRRDLATLLEGAGWAMNARVYLDVALADRLTRRPAVPPTNLSR